MPFVNDQLLRAVDTIRSAQGPLAFAWVSTQITVTQRFWFGGIVGAEGGTNDSTIAGSPLVLAQQYPVEPVTTAQIMGSGGQYEVGDVRVGPITPAYNDTSFTPAVAGGYSEAQLHPVTTRDDVEVLYTLKGAHAGDYQFVALESWDPTSYYLVLRRRASPPVEPPPAGLGP